MTCGYRNIVAAISAACLLAISGGSTVAKERPWFKYENAYFEAYSDAPQKKVRPLLEELENFRAAVVQVMAIDIPPGAVKTQVVMFRSMKDFRSLTGNRRIAAFVTGLSGVPHIVMPVGRRGSPSEFYIRHEYVHVLMGYSKHTFPPWFHEGVAEFMSGTQFEDDGENFTLGAAIARPKIGRVLVPWQELTSRDFDVHSLATQEKASNAYYQSWLLTHYLIIGDKAQHYPKLSAYLGRFAAGESSVSAFQAEFGMSVDELGELVMQKYRKQISYYKIGFQPDAQDHEFVRTEADGLEIAKTIDSLGQVRFSAPSYSP